MSKSNTITDNGSRCRWWMKTRSSLKARLLYQGTLAVAGISCFCRFNFVDGDPLVNCDLVAEPDKNFILIMEDGNNYRSAIK